MTDVTGRHGYLLLWEGSGTDRGTLGRDAVERALWGLGFGRFGRDDDGRPALVVLSAGASKAEWFEAGFWAGAGVPLFAAGRGTQFRTRHRETLARLGGWCQEAETVADLIAMVARRGLRPTAWDAARVEETLAGVEARAAREAAADREAGA